MICWHKWTTITISGTPYRECQRCLKLMVKPKGYWVWAVMREALRKPKYYLLCKLKHKWVYSWYGSYTTRECKRCGKNQYKEYGGGRWITEWDGKK